MPGVDNAPMAANPHPTHITAEMWWFIEQLELLEPADTVFAGAWGNFKPGYHCDAFNLWWRRENGVYVWRNDYSTRGADDKVLGTSLERFGAAVDWTFLSAQRGDSSQIRKYGARIRTAWLNRDPRLKGWREVLTQGDGDPQADGYDFVSWTERTPDLTHTWHFHFSCLRKYLRTLSVFQAMLSILRGETLAQWLGTGDDMFFFQVEDQGAGRMNGCTYEFAPDYPTMLKWQAAWPGVPTKKVRRVDVEAGLYGIGMHQLINSSGPAPIPAPGDGVTAAQVHEIVRDELDHVKLVSDLE